MTSIVSFDNGLQICSHLKILRVLAAMNISLKIVNNVVKNV